MITSHYGVTSTLHGPLGLRWPDGTVARYDHLNLFEWCDSPADAEVLWAAWVEADGATVADATSGELPEGALAVVRYAHGTAVFYDRFVRLDRPDYDPRWLAKPTPETYEGFDSRPALAVSNARWAGPAGPFDVVLRFTTVNYHHQGSIQLTAFASSGCTLEAATLQGTTVPLDGGRARWHRVTLYRDKPVELRLRGRCIGSSTIPVHFNDLDGSPRDGPGDFRMGAGTIELEVQAGWLTLVRGAERIRLEPAWLAQLEQQGLLETATRPPDLQRWIVRALRRCRVETVAEAPAAVLEAWSTMTRPERAVEAPQGIPRFKFLTGQHWIVTDAEATLLRKALPPDHPLHRFASSAFEVVGPDPLQP